MKRIRTVNQAYLLLVSLSIILPIILRRVTSGLTVHQSMIISEVLIVGAALAVVWPLDRKLIGEVQQAPMKTRTFLQVILFGMLLQPVVLWLNLFSQLFATNYVAQSMETTMGSSFFFNLMYIAVAPALAEEFVFRGLIYHGYRQVGVRRAAVMSGLLFGLLHMNVNQFVYAFALGVLLALLVEATGSIYSSMLIHFMINERTVVLYDAAQELAAQGLVQSTVEQLEPEVMQSYIRQALLVSTPIALLCAVGLFFLIRRIAKGCGRGEYFDLVLHGQEQTVRHMRGEAADTAAWSPAERASAFVPETDETYETADRRERLLALAPAIAAAVLCVGYMIWLELF